VLARGFLFDFGDSRHGASLGNDEGERGTGTGDSAGSRIRVGER
jgi:hypothetical protein